MFSRVLKRWKSARAVEATIPPGIRVYAVGDIHGRADLLDDLARQIATELPQGPEKILTIFLGDYIDRGMRSAEVVDRLSRRDFPTEIITLRGNHEQTMLDAFEAAKTFGFWRKYGGLETLASYKIDVSDVMKGVGYLRARDEINEKVPAAHRAFLASLPHSHQLGDYFFCHAGVRPGVPLEDQNEYDLMWGRDEFLGSNLFHGKVIVHGHTPVEEPEFRTNRINIDTGAYATGRLTCLALENSSRRLLSF